MRVAFVGKGGAGKSAIAGTFARLLARTGEEVLVLDSDPLPGLAFSLGVESTDAGIPDDAVEENAQGERPAYRLRADLTVTQAVDRYARHGPDGVRVLQFGKLGGPDEQRGASRRSQFAFRQIIADLPQDRWSVVGDLPGGTRQPFFAWGGYAETMLIVVEPTAKSLLSARRLSRLAETKQAPRVVAVASKTREPGDAQRIAVRTGLEVVADIPDDLALADAERRGQAPIDGAPESAAVRAIGSLVERLRAEDRVAGKPLVKETQR